ncbi:6,7-dimethyl-8-ribityllumazine synthase [Geminicoccus flavidas]|uniref:6,7-dimethyl-8-ribityllumazine synthase n=1 Tax=Geminicoccus flavidas TaxID=2506407 RepID=UPI001359B932
MGAAFVDQSSSRFAFIQSCWHKEIVDQCRDGFLARMADGGVQAGWIDLFEVPGAFEIPLHAKLLAKSGRYRAVVAAGMVVDGGIYRHEFVAQAVISGLMQVQLETLVPVLSAVLTPQQFHEHGTHHDFFFQHFRIKGREVAEACLGVTAALAKLPG